MSSTAKIIIVAALFVSAAALVVVKHVPGESPGIPVSKTDSSLPVLVDLGADKCIPCKAMKPILDDLSENYSEQFKVTFIDVWKNRAKAERYKINIIPTQIFFDASGNELFRHEGFYSREDILGKWKELGVNIEKGTE